MILIYIDYTAGRATAIKVGVTVIEISTDDRYLIHVTVSGNKEAFSYPNIIDVLKE